MFFLHVIAAILATFRLTEMMLTDRIAEPLRNKLKGYLWTCPRCLSVWSGIIATICIVFLPWLNWPLAFAYLYLVHVEFVVARRRATRKEFLLYVDDKGNAKVQHSDLEPQQLKMLGAILAGNQSGGQVNAPVL